MQRDERDRQIQHDAEREEDPIGVAPADVVGRARPDEPAEHVEQADHPDETGSGHRRDGALEHFLDHHRGLSEDADAGGHIEAQDQPQQVELPCHHRLVDMHVALGDHFLRCCGRGPAGWFPVGRRDADGQ